MSARDSFSSSSINKKAEEKTWNRVLQPPGGHSSINLVWEASPSDRVQGKSR